MVLIETGIDKCGQAWTSGDSCGQVGTNVENACRHGEDKLCAHTADMSRCGEARIKHGWYRQSWAVGNMYGQMCVDIGECGQE